MHFNNLCLPIFKKLHDSKYPSTSVNVSNWRSRKRNKYKKNKKPCSIKKRTGNEQTQRETRGNETRATNHCCTCQQLLSSEELEQRATANSSRSTKENGEYDDGNVLRHYFKRTFVGVNWLLVIISWWNCVDVICKNPGIVCYYFVIF